jgi:hypothetical protein
LSDQSEAPSGGLARGGDRPSLTPTRFDYEDDKIFVNTASHRRKCEWIRKNPRVVTSLLVNRDNAYHRFQIRHTMVKEFREWVPGSEYVTQQFARISTKYTGIPPPHGLHAPKIDEKRVLFVCHIDRIATLRKR